MGSSAYGMRGKHVGVEEEDDPGRIIVNYRLAGPRNPAGTLHIARLLEELPHRIKARDAVRHCVFCGRPPFKHRGVCWPCYCRLQLSCNIEGGRLSQLLFERCAFCDRKPWIGNLCWPCFWLLKTRTPLAVSVFRSSRRRIARLKSRGKHILALQESLWLSAKSHPTTNQ